MTNEDYNKWAHRFLGNKCFHEIVERGWDNEGIGICRHCKEEIYHGRMNYCSDLNLAAELEAKTEDVKVWRIAYAWNLAEIIYQSEISRKDTFIHIDMAGAMAKATAKQRVQAAYETMKEVKE